MALVHTKSNAQASDRFGVITDIAPEYVVGGGYRNGPN